MLGMQSHNTPIVGEKAKQLRHQLFRLSTDRLNADDVQRRQRMVSIHNDVKHNVEWT